MPSTATYTIKHRDDFDSNGNWRLARRGLGVESFGINLVDIPAGESIKEHDEVDRDQEEVYIVLNGEPTFVVDGESIPARAGTYARFAPEPRRNVVNDGDTTASILIISAPVSSGYEPMSWA